MEKTLGDGVVGKNQGGPALIGKGRCLRAAGIFQFLLVLLVAAAAGAFLSGENFRIDRELLRQAEARYGKEAATQLLEWEELIRRDRSRTDLEKPDALRQ